MRWHSASRPTDNPIRPAASGSLRHSFRLGSGRKVLAGDSRVFTYLCAVLPLALMLGAPACAQPAMICPGGAIALDISAAAKPFVRMRLGEREGNFLIDTGATRSHVDATL